MTPYQLLTTHLAPYHRDLALGMALMFAEMATALATPWLAGRFAAQVGGGLTPTTATRGLLLAWALVLVVQFAARALGQYRLSWVSARVMVDLSRRVHEHLQVVPLAFHQRRRAGELLALLSHDVTQLSHFVAGPLAGVLPLLALSAGAAGMVLWIDPLFGLAVLLLAPVLVVLVKLLTRSARPLAGAAVREQAASLAVASETLGMLRLVKAHALEAVRDQAYRAQTETMLAVRRRQLWLQATLTPVVYLVAAFVLLGLLWWAGERLRAGRLGAPELISISLYGLLLIRPVSGLGGAYLQWQHARGAAGRVVELLEQRPEPFDAGGPVLAPLRDAIAFDGVAFAYPGRPALLRGIDLELRRGETVALTGANGAGKTTLVHLLMRFVAPTAGRITFDGRDIAGVDLASLRRQIGYVPQEVLIANASVRDNIAFGRPAATDEEVAAAARAARADEFIARLPDGFATRVGDQGVGLSGGQRQRLALARALLHRPALLILDEATSQIDPHGEAEFIAAAATALAGHTVIVISHRPAMLALATRVYRLEDGRLHEEPGAHG